MLRLAEPKRVRINRIATWFPRERVLAGQVRYVLVYVDLAVTYENLRDSDSALVQRS